MSPNPLKFLDYFRVTPNFPKVILVTYTPTREALARLGTAPGVKGPAHG